MLYRIPGLRSKRAIEDRTSERARRSASFMCKAVPSLPLVRQRFPLAVGIDVVTVAEVASALERYGDRYVRNAFTTQEAAYCRQAAGAAAAARFAVRFAAKEATVKTLHPRQRWIDWTAIEVKRARSGRCAIVLRRDAAALADRRGFDQFELSMSHDGDHAVAIVVALRRPRRKNQTGSDD